MPKTRHQKEEELSLFRKKLSDLKEGILVFINFSGLSVVKLSQLRREIKKEGGELKVIKKAIAHKAFEDAGIAADPRTLEGETAFVFGYKDPVAVTKLIHRTFLQEKKPVMLGAWFERRLLGKQEVLTFAALPSRIELIASVVGSIAQPMRGLLGVFNETMAGFVRVLDAKAKRV